MNLKLVKQNNTMLVDEIINWYDRNVNYKLTKSFINFLIKVGIIKKDLALEEINLFLLERYGEEYVKENGAFKIKKNRIDVIKKFPDEKPKVTEKPKSKNVEKPKSKNVTLVKNKQTTVSKKESPANRKFKIENLGGRKLKLIKL